MKTLHKINYSIFMLFLLFGTLYSNNLSEKELNSLLSLDNMGRYHIVAFPMNEVDFHPKQALEMYIAANEDGKVRIKSKHLNFNREYNIKSGEIITLSSFNGDLDWSYEITGSDSLSNKAFEIESTVPVSVYVMNSKNYSTDGYRAIPVKNWGQEYRHCSYYDFNEGRNWGGGFIIMAAEDNTVVEVNLQGKGDDSEIDGPRNFNDPYTINLKKGETYMIKGKGESRGEFDISGSHIVSNKPIGLISFHQRTMIPSNRTVNGRNHLSEMLKPVESWGENYYTVELDRGTDMGDFFRIMASEDNTVVTADWYDKETGERIYGFKQTIQNAGEYIEAQQIASTDCEDGEVMSNVPSIRGFSYIRASSPVQVIQYSYSSCWDNAGGAFDPFMIDLSPIEQHTQKVSFMTPQNKTQNEFNDNYLNLVIKGDPNDKQRDLELLNSVELDGQAILDIDPSIIDDKMIDSMYWATLPLEPGTHTLTAGTKINGFIYGFAFVDSYGWPIGNAGYDLTKVDESQPEIKKEEISFGKFRITAMENKAGDSKIFRDPIIISSENFKSYLDSDHEDENWYLNPNGEKELNYIFEVEDHSKDAQVTFAIMDNYGNVSIETISSLSSSVEKSTEIEGNIVEIYPNPVDNQLKINSNSSILIDYLKLLNANGKVVLQQNNLMLPNSLDVSSISAGMYFIEIGKDGNVYRLKFAK